jgi:Ca2+-binding RTX toxin-like protein
MQWGMVLRPCLLALVILLAFAGVAHAGTVSLDPAGYTLTADDRQENTVTVGLAPDGRVRFTDRFDLSAIALLGCEDLGMELLCPAREGLTVLLGDRNDTLVLEGAGLRGAIRAAGEGGDDRLAGSAADETLEGGDGNDRLSGGRGADRLVGGAGRDDVDYAERTTPVTLVADGTESSGAPGERDAIGADVEGLGGGAGADRLTGGPGADWLSGGAGDDRLDGREGGDVLDGGTGTDHLSYADRTAAVTVTVGTATADDGAVGEGDRVVGVER